MSTRWPPEKLLWEAEVVDGTLHRVEEPLTAEMVWAKIEVALVREGCRLEETIVAPGHGGADPRWPGEGPVLPGDPVVIHIFPRTPTKYHGDMTRTFVHGGPTNRFRRCMRRLSPPGRRHTTCSPRAQT